MIGLVTVIHAIICVLLAVFILMQSGRGGGLTEGFASADSVFGAQTNEMMIKGTTIMAIIFFITCLSLALLSSRRNDSLMENRISVEAPDLGTQSVAVPVAETPTAQPIPVAE